MWAAPARAWQVDTSRGAGRDGGSGLWLRDFHGPGVGCFGSAAVDAVPLFEAWVRVGFDPGPPGALGCLCSGRKVVTGLRSVGLGDRVVVRLGASGCRRGVSVVSYPLFFYDLRGRSRADLRG